MAFSTEAGSTSGLEVLDREECFAKLSMVPVGRVAVARGHRPPLVVPVNFALDGEMIVFRTDLGAKLMGLRTQPVTFQVDFVDPFHLSGWSVLIEGVAYEATEDEVSRISLHSWVAGPKDHWVRIVPVEVSGRRIRLPELPLDGRGYL